MNGVFTPQVKDWLVERLMVRHFLIDMEVQQGVQEGGMSAYVDAMVESQQDFQDLVITAMAEFSDEGTVPELTLDEVLALASDQRNSLK